MKLARLTVTNTTPAQGKTLLVNTHFAQKIAIQSPKTRVILADEQGIAPKSVKFARHQQDLIILEDNQAYFVLENYFDYYQDGSGVFGSALNAGFHDYALGSPIGYIDINGGGFLVNDAMLLASDIGRIHPWYSVQSNLVLPTLASAAALSAGVALVSNNDSDKSTIHQNSNLANPDTVNSNPVNPTPENPDPVNPNPTNPNPTNPNPVNPDPVNPNPINPNPVNPAPPNQVPTDIELLGVSVLENKAGAAIGALKTTDGDDTNHHYHVSDERFEVVNGILKLKDDQILLFDNEKTVRLEVTANDGRGGVLTKNFVLNVVDDPNFPDLPPTNPPTPTPNPTPTEYNLQVLDAQSVVEGEILSYQIELDNPSQAGQILKIETQINNSNVESQILSYTANPFAVGEYLANGTVFTRGVDDMPLVANSDDIARYAATLSAKYNNFGVSSSLNTSAYNIPIYIVDSNDPNQHYAIFGSKDGRVLNSASIVDNTMGKIPFPEYGIPAGGGDKSFAVYDKATGMFREYFYAVKTDDGWQVSSAGYYQGQAGLDLSDNFWMQLTQGSSAVVRMLNPLSQIGISEVLAGSINHAVSVTFPNAAAEPSFPAKDSDGDDVNPNAPAHGQWFRLPKFDNNGNPIDFNTYLHNGKLLNPLTRMIAKAVQEYGGYGADTNKHNFAFNAESPFNYIAQGKENPWRQGGEIAWALGGTTHGDPLNVNDFPWELVQWAPMDWDNKGVDKGIYAATDPIVTIDGIDYALNDDGEVVLPNNAQTIVVKVPTLTNNNFVQTDSVKLTASLIAEDKVLSTDSGMGLVQDATSPIASPVDGTANDDVLVSPTMGGDVATALQGLTDKELVSYLARHGNIALKQANNAISRTLNGGDGDDILVGGVGIDLLRGGDGADKFVFAMDGINGQAYHSIDQIVDFDSNQDSIILTKGANWVLQSLEFVEAAHVQRLQFKVYKGNESYINAIHIKSKDGSLLTKEQVMAAVKVVTDGQDFNLYKKGEDPTPVTQASQEIYEPTGWIYFEGDEFNGSTLDHEKWFVYGDDYRNWGKGKDTEGYNSRYGSNMNMLQTYTDTDQYINVKDGVLTINSYKDDSLPQIRHSDGSLHDAWRSAAISTQETDFYFPLFSRVDVRAKIANAEGIWHGPWLRHFKGASTAELDLNENFVNEYLQVFKNDATLNPMGDGLNISTQSIHLHNKETGKLQTSVIPNTPNSWKSRHVKVDGDMDEEFHIYSVQVERTDNVNEAKITYLIDGQVSYSITTDERFGRDVLNKFIEDANQEKMQQNAWNMIFQGGIGGDIVKHDEVGVPNDSLNHVQSQIDYVRVFVRPDELERINNEKALSAGKIITASDLGIENSAYLDAKLVANTPYHTAYEVKGDDANNILQGNQWSNVMRGFDGDDRLIGGMGHDVMIGGRGNDVFALDAMDAYYDVIVDFTKGNDKIDLSNESIFQGLSADNFAERVTIVEYEGYNTVIRYDADGKGGNKPVDILQLSTQLDLAIDDFIL